MQHIPRVVISGLSGGAGKTMVSLGLARALARSGLKVKACKKGPDYIDAAWLALAARSSQSNLDPFFLAPDALRAHFLRAAAGHELAIIEGNRGIFDGLDLSGSCSTAELARILQAPVVLVLDCTKMTRTAAALIKGCMDFEKDLRIGGVILNRTGNPRHQHLVRRAVEELAGAPVLGVLPRQVRPFIMERHMGLVGLEEHALADAALDALADCVSEHLDLEALRELAAQAPSLPANGLVPHAVPLPGSGFSGQALSVVSQGHMPQAPSLPEKEHALRASPLPGSGFAAQAVKDESASGSSPGLAAAGARIGYVRDAAFWFYYEENLAALREAGAELVPLSLLSAVSGREREDWEKLDGLYIGGGQPELHAGALADNVFCREQVAALARGGLPVYAECGGFMYLARELVLDGRVFPMAGVFSCSVEFCSRPQGLGYVEAEVTLPNPFHPVGLCFRGHEFHFSRCLAQGGSGGEGALPPEHVLRLRKGRGMRSCPEQGNFDGLLRQNTFAAYTHIFAPALPHWAERFVALCAGRRS